MNGEQKHQIALEIAKICTTANINEYLVSSDNNKENKSNEKISKRDMLMNDFITDYYKVLDKLSPKNNQHNI